jgi:hypothetical protein
MRVKVGNTASEIEVGQYREVNKGALKAFFTLVEYPYGRKTLDCRYFVQGDNRWVNFPQKEVNYSDGRKPEYIPLVSYLDKAYLDQLKEAILLALKDMKPGDKNGQSNAQAYQRKENPIQAEPSSSWRSSPF